MSSRSIPAMPTAVRAPGTLRSRSLPWFWIVRTLPTRPEGRTRTVSPRARLPDHAVPVTTVPTPATETARSHGGRKEDRRNESDRAVRKPLAFLECHHLGPLAFDRIHLGDHRNAGWNAQLLDHRNVSPRLGQ